MSIAQDLLEHYEPLFDFLLVKEIPQIHGNIVITAGRECGLPRYCKVIKAGPGRESDVTPGKYMDMPVKVGDIVVVNGDQQPYGHHVLKGSQYVLIVRATSMFIMGVVDELPEACRPENAIDPPVEEQLPDLIALP